MNRHLYIYITLLMLMFSQGMFAQLGFDVASVEAYIADHKAQRSLLIARATLEESNSILHGYTKESTLDYKNINEELDKYTRAFDVIDLLYQSLRTGMNCYTTYNTISDRITGYKDMLENFNRKCLSRGDIVTTDSLIITINLHMLQKVADEGDNLYRSVSDLILYASGAAACTTADLMAIVTNINNSLDNIQKHLNKAYFETWRYIQVRIGYWKRQVYRAKTKQEIIEGAFGRWRKASHLGQDEE